MNQVDVVWASLPEHAGSAYALLRTEVARTCGVEPREVRLGKMCGRCGSNKHGKPYVVPVGGIRPPHVSLGRAGRLAMVAVTHRGPVGVDIERADAPSFAGFDAVALHPGEETSSVRDRAITWVRKESLLKATGDGLSVDPRRIRLSEPGHLPELLEWEAANPPLGRVWMYDASVGSAHVAGLSVLSEERPELNVREAAPEDLLPEASA